jgi:O-antigen/teichoic acid export membrane protein
MRQITGNTLILLANNVGSAALAFLISVLIARGLGAEGLGQYAFIMAWVSPLVALSDFGMGSLITRDVARRRDSAGPLLHSATLALVPLAAAVFAVAVLIVPTLKLSPALTIALTLVALLIVLDPWYGLYTALFRAFEWMWPILAINVGGLALQLLLTGIALQAGAGLVGVAQVLIVINVLQLVATWWLWRAYRFRTLSATQPSPVFENTIRVRDVLRQAWPFALAAVLNALQLRLNILLLERLSGDTGVGLYAAASRFVEAGRLIPSAMFGALFPALSSLAAQPEAMRRTFTTAARLLFAFGITFALAMTLFGGWLIRITYDPKGSAFSGAAPVLTVLSWSLVPSLLRGGATLYLYGQGREHLVNVLTIGALIAQAGVGWLLIGQWGALGGAITIVIIEGGTILCLWNALRARSVTPSLP